MSMSTENGVFAGGHQATTASGGPMSVAASYPALTAADDQRVLELMAALHERDGVVQMLTQRLEQAADQLDRLQRSGADRRGSIPGVPAEFLDSQQTLLDQMNRVLGQWEEMQAGHTLVRIESQIQEIHELVANGTTTMSSSSVAAPTPRTSVSATNTTSAAKAISSKSSWECIKAAMMADESLTAPQPATSSQVSSAVVTSPTAFPLPTTSTPISEAPPLPELPSFVEIQQATPDELRLAIQSRDECISTLVRRVVAQDQTTRIPDWTQLAQAPADLRRTLDDIRRQLQEKLRIAEVDLSLQRARMAREEARLQTKAEQIERQMRKIGMSTEDSDAGPNQNAQPARSADAQSAQQGRRWLQFLQRPANTPTE